jgi:sensor histidine kinase YesM
MVCDVVSTVPFVKYTEGKNTDQILFVAGDFLFLICELLVEKIVDTKAEVEHQKFPLILVPICSVAIVFFMAYSGNELNMEIVVVSMGLLLINFLVLYLYNVLLRALMQSYENEMLNQKLQMYANQLDIITQNEKQIAALRHDLKHHLNELKLLAMQDEGEKIQNYIESMEEFIQNPDEIISSGNTEIDSLLNYMLKRGQKELKEVNVKVQLPEDMSHSYDINVILGNLLENAIEASAMTEDKILRGNISLKQNILKIRIENSYNNNLKKGKSGYITTKPDERHHGIGLKNVQRVVEKYNGLMEITENDLFCVKIIMYM